MSSSPDPRAPREGALLRGASAARAVAYRNAGELLRTTVPAPRGAASTRPADDDAGPSPVERRAAVRRAADPPGAPGGAPAGAPGPRGPAGPPGGVSARGAPPPPPA